METTERIKRYNSGESIYSIAKKAGVSRQAIMSTLMKAEVYSPGDRVAFVYEKKVNNALSLKGRIWCSLKKLRKNMDLRNDISEIVPIRIEYNHYNGFMFTLLGLEIGGFDSMLFGVHLGWKRYFIIYLFFIPIEIKKPWY